MRSLQQQHLNYKDTINYGSYYTPEKLVNLVYRVLSKNISNLSDHKFLDTSCGYGNFLQKENSIGADIDKQALEVAKKSNKSIFFNHNSLKNIDRKQYDLVANDKIIVIGNPPYNDTTSIIRSNIKKENFEIDEDVRSRDLGISFLLSYNKLCADYVCVLHPLSYLIKRTNFEMLKNFKDNYVLQDSIIVSSNEFSATSRTTSFPIIIALYKRCDAGMNYNFICEYNFKTVDNKSFSIKEQDLIEKYITKYPNQKFVNKNNAIAYFWTMRDINALKRSKTFVNEESYNSIRVTRDKLEYYCYVDVFKEYISHIPYYFGNSNIMINHCEFQKIKFAFVAKSIKKYDFLRHLASEQESNVNYDLLIDNYFKNLLGDHYVD